MNCCVVKGPAALESAVFAFVGRNYQGLGVPWTSLRWPDGEVWSVVVRTPAWQDNTPLTDLLSGVHL
jgi:hypothetical protein